MQYFFIVWILRSIILKLVTNDFELNLFRKTNQKKLPFTFRQILGNHNLTPVLIFDVQKRSQKNHVLNTVYPPKYWEKHDNMDNKFLMWDVLASFSNNYYGVISHRNKKCWMVNLTHFGLNYCLKNPIVSYFSKSLTLETSASVPNFGVWLGKNQFWILAHKKLIWKFI